MSVNTRLDNMPAWVRDEILHIATAFEGILTTDQVENIYMAGFCNGTRNVVGK